MSAFCLGDILQAISTCDEHASFKNYCTILLLLVILNSDSPETTVADFLNPSELICIFLLSAIWDNTSLLVIASMIYSSILSFNN